MQLNAKRTQIERKKNVPRTDSQIRKVSGNNFNPAMEPRTDKIVGTNNSCFLPNNNLFLIYVETPTGSLFQVVDGRNPETKPVEVGSLSPVFYRVSYMLGRLFGISEPSTV